MTIRPSACYHTHLLPIQVRTAHEMLHLRRPLGVLHTSKRRILDPRPGLAFCADHPRCLQEAAPGSFDPRGAGRPQGLLAGVEPELAFAMEDLPFLGRDAMLSPVEDRTLRDVRGETCGNTAVYGSDDVWGESFAEQREMR